MVSLEKYIEDTARFIRNNPEIDKFYKRVTAKFPDVIMTVRLYYPVTEYLLIEAFHKDTTLDMIYNECKDIFPKLLTNDMEFPVEPIVFLLYDGNVRLSDHSVYYKDYFANVFH